MTEEQTGTLELHVAELRQLFNAMDPAPFRERDLDPNAVSYIVDWARETPASQPLALVLRLERESPTADARQMLTDAAHEYFRRRAAVTRRQLKRLFRVGRISLVIGIAFATAAASLGEILSSLVGQQSHIRVLTESVVIFGWVALWRPAEIFLYDWWPIRAEAKMFDRLAEIDVSLHGSAPATAVPA